MPVWGVNIKVKKRLIRFKRTWSGKRVGALFEPPASVGRSRHQVHKGKHFGKQGKRCFPKDCLLPVARKNHRRQAWSLLASASFQRKVKKYFLGVLRALSEAGGSLFISTLQPHEPNISCFKCPAMFRSTIPGSGKQAMPNNRHMPNQFMPCSENVQSSYEINLYDL